MARRRSVFFRLILSSAILMGYLVSLLALTPRPAHAATYTVTTAADAATCATAPAGSLRATLCNPALAPGDIINISVAGPIVLAANQPNITVGGLTINGAPTTIQGGVGIRGFAVVAGGVLTLNNLTITGGNCNGGCPVVVNGGGGVVNWTGTVNITNSTLSGNRAQLGGGVYNGGTVNITNSTLSGNSALGAGNGYGGGVYNGGTVNITNSTLSGNSANSAEGGMGGGVYNGNTLTITNSTLSGNSANLVGGGIYNSRVVTVRNTIVTASTNGDCQGAWVAGSANNLTDTATCAGRLGAVTNISATLANNGGPTQTLALLAGSNALDRTAAPCAVGTDQRGTGRPQGTGCDIGAFELAATPIPTAQPAASEPEGPQWPAPPPCPDAMTRVDPAIRANVPPGIARDAKGVLATVYICPLTKTYEIGVLDREIIRAYEVFALTPNGDASVTRFTGPIRVCLQGNGTFLFRDANNAPRVVSELSVTIEDGFTCASVPHAGTIVLVTGAPRQTAPQTVSEKPLTDCQITTRNITNLRDAPNANAPIVAIIATNTTLKATARAGDWLKVIYQDRQGYLSAGIVNADGVCQ